MQRYGIGEQEFKMAKLLWEREGIGSGEVVKLCAEEFGWKKSTTYTMLRRLTEHGLFQNKESIVTSVMSEEQHKAKVAKDLIDDKFSGSIAELAAVVMKRYGISEEEREKLAEVLG
ncbi:MAG: BlaI/MecI/CopY family transcriptional regulator [Lachnospiraceae bacterium]|nr:BlaI/MecI/CopY family transcriptional regulator [Lachnospiraceae bacterium]